MRAALFGGSSSKPSARPNQFAAQESASAATAPAEASRPPVPPKKASSGAGAPPATEEEDALRSNLFKGSSGKGGVLEKPSEAGDEPQHDGEVPMDDVSAAPVDDRGYVSTLRCAV